MEARGRGKARKSVMTTRSFAHPLTLLTSVVPRTVLVLVVKEYWTKEKGFQVTVQLLPHQRRLVVSGNHEH